MDEHPRLAISHIVDGDLERGSAAIIHIDWSSPLTEENFNLQRYAGSSRS